METTAHDRYLKLAAGRDIAIGDRLHFFAYSSHVLRSLEVDVVREQRALRRGCDRDIVTLDTAAGEGIAASADVEAVNDALEDLARLDPSLARLVEMRFFGGMTETRSRLAVSKRTVTRAAEGARAAAHARRRRGLVKLSAEAWREVEPLLSAALDLEGAERGACLASLEATHPGSAPLLRRLLASHERAMLHGELETVSGLAPRAA